MFILYIDDFNNNPIDLHSQIASFYNSRLDQFKAKDNAQDLSNYDPSQDTNPYPNKAFNLLLEMFKNGLITHSNNGAKKLFEVIPPTFIPLFSNQYQIYALGMHSNKCALRSTNIYYIIEFVDSSLHFDMYSTYQRISCTLTEPSDVLLSLSLACVDNQDEVKSLAEHNSLDICVILKEICGNNIYVKNNLGDTNSSFVPFSDHSITCEIPHVNNTIDHGEL